LYSSPSYYVLPCAATLIGVQIFFSHGTLAGSAETSSIYLRNSTAGSDLLLSNAVVNNTWTQQIAVTGLNQDYAAGTKLQGKWIAPTWAGADPTGVCYEIVLLFAT
jgi:hypothetical protein